MKKRMVQFSVFVSSVFLILFCNSGGDSGAPNENAAAGGSEAEAPVMQVQYAEPTREPIKLALLVAINDYKSDKISDLAGCVNDIENMKALLIGKYEFKEENIKVLINEQATHANIVKAIQEHLIGQAQRDDIVVFHYSGHGSQMKDQPAPDGDEDDGWDETIVPYDSRTEGVYDVSDDQLNGLLALLNQRTKNITFIFDSCHSGTITRGSGIRRYIPPDERTPPPAPSYALKTRGASQGANDLRPANLNYVLVSGCLSKQSSFEHYANGKENGALTFFLTQELRKAGGGTTWRDIIDAVRGSVNAYYPNQLPQLEGADIDKFVFNDGTGLAQPYVLASPKGAAQVALNAGQAQGLTTGSIYHVFSPGSKEFSDLTKAIAELELTEVSAFNSTAKYVKGSKIPEFSRAVETRRNYPDMKLRIYYKDLASSAVLKAAKAELDGFQHLEVMPQERNYHLLLREKDGRIVIENGDTYVLSNSVAVSDPDAVKRVKDQMTAWAKWYNLLAVENPNSQNRIKFTLTAVSGAASRDPYKVVSQKDATLREGEFFECRVENTSKENLYISILDISTDGSVSLIYPHPEGASELLKADSFLVRRFETYIPEGRETVKDIIKVFATREPADFRVLTQPPVRGGVGVDHTSANNPLGKLLDQAALGATRGARPAAVDLSSWETSMRVFEVVKAN